MPDEVKVRIKADDKASANMKKIGTSSTKMSANFKKAGVAMTAVGIGLVTVMGKMINSYGKAGDEIQKMAKRTGWSTEALSEMRHAAELSGSSLQSIEKASKKMSKTIIDASDGLETYVRVFDKLGINIEALRAQKPEEQFWTISEALADLQDHTEKAAIAQDVFGRAGTELIPLFSETSDAIGAMREEAHELGVVFDQSAADSAAAFEDAKTRLGTAFTGISNSIAMVIMPKVTELITALTEKLKPAIEWLAEHPEWIKWGAVAAGLTLIGGAMLLIIPKVVALIAALITLHGLMGPAGWAKMAIGLGIAAATIAGLGIMAKKAFAGEGATTGVSWTGPGPPGPPRPGTHWIMPGEAGWVGYGQEGPKPPSLQYGGIVRGPIGKPIPVLAHGGERFLGQGGGGGITVNIYPQGFVMAGRELALMVREELLHLKARNVNTGL